MAEVLIAVTFICMDAPIDFELIQSTYSTRKLNFSLKLHALQKCIPIDLPDSLAVMAIAPPGGRIYRGLILGKNCMLVGIHRFFNFIPV